MPIRELEALPVELHWFCAIGSDHDASAGQPASPNEATTTEKDLRARQDQGADILLLYTYDDAAEFQERVKSRIDLQLGRCDVCIGNYYKARNRLDERLREDYDEEQTNVVQEKLDEQDFARIEGALDDVAELLEKLEPAERHKNTLEVGRQLAFFESLCSDTFVHDASRLDRHLATPFKLIQTNKRLAIQRYVPAATCFLFDADEYRHEWAKQTWFRYKNTPTKEDFEYAIKGPLLRQLRSISLSVPDAATLQRFWEGIGLILRNLDNDLITHSLRALDVDVFKMALEHLRFETESFWPLVEAIQIVLELAPKDFWDSMGAISPTTFVEQIFNNAQYDRFLISSKPGDADQATPLRDLLSWIKPFLESLDTANQAGVCRSLSFQFLQRLQAERFPEHARVECYRQGLATLATTLSSLDKDQASSSTGRIAAKDVLELVGEHMGDISKISLRPESLLKQTCLELSLRVVNLTLTVESKSVRSDQRSVTQLTSKGDLPPAFGVYVTPIWEAVIRNLDPGNIGLAKAVLIGMNDLSGCEKMRINTDDPHANEKSKYNVKIGRLTHFACQVLNRVDGFSTQDLDHIYRDPDSAIALVSTLFAADANLFEAGVNLLKSLTSELARKEAIAYLLKTHLETSLNAFSWAIRRIARSKSFPACPRMLKTSTDVIDALCDSQDGLLRKMGLFEESQKRSIKAFWKDQWNALRIIYELTETWGRSRVEDHSVLKEFCRDTMQFSERLFDQYSVFANSLQDLSPFKIVDSNSKPANISVQLLQHPTMTLQAMIRWLRLRDVFLVNIAVKLTDRVLHRLTAQKTRIDDTTSKTLEQIVTGGPQGRTNLTGQEKAELANALEANIGRQLIQVVDVDSESTPDQTRASTPSHGVSRGHKKKEAIDLEAWRAKSKVSSIRRAGQFVDVSDEDEFDGQNVADRDLLAASRKAETLHQTIGQHALAARGKQAPPGQKRAIEASKHKGVVQGSIKANQHQSETQRATFLEKRRAEQEAEKRRKAENAAMLRKKAAIQVPGQGSAISGIGVRGKDHAPQGPSMMVSSESEEESDDDEDDGILGHLKSKSAGQGLKDIRASRAQALRGPVKKTKQIRSIKDMRARLAPDLTALHKVVLSWDFFHEGQLPPSSDQQNYQMVSNTFRNPMDYRATFEPLLLLEAWQQFLKSKEDGNFKISEVKIASRMAVDSFVELSSSIPANEVKEAGIGEADIVLLSKHRSPAAEATEPHCFARVHKITRKRGSVEVTFRATSRNGLIEHMIPNVSLFCAKITSFTPVEREYGALQGLQYFDLCDEITRAKPSPLLEYTELQMKGAMANHELNLAQAKAVRSAVDNDAFTLIQGPPGSGKTKTIIAIVGALLTNTLVTQGQAIPRPGASTVSNGQPPASKKLLICAPSNAAVDELVMRLKKGVRTSQGEKKRLSIVRLGRSEAINANVLDVTLEELVNAKLNIVIGKIARPGEEIGQLMTTHKSTYEEFKTLRAIVDTQKATGKPVTPEQNRDMDTLRRKVDILSKKIDTARDSGNVAQRNADINRHKAQQEVLDGAHVLCATLSGSGHDMFQKLNVEFETVIIDEAAQSVELSALIPLKYGCSKCILVGDPKQLPPTVLSREAARFQYEQSLFVRMQENHPNDVHLLDTQYRMHPDISQFPCKAFYGGKLVDGPDMAGQRVKPWHDSKLLGTYRFFDVQGIHSSAPRGHSLINLAEVDVAMKLYSRLTTDCKGYDFDGKIGIITPYRSQLRELRTRFAQRFGDAVLTAVEFNTTDAFQGRESEVIIFSCVRASLTRGIGFLSDIRRMNVGITRAKSSLWLLGNAQSLMQGEFWSQLIDDAKQRKVFVSGNLNGILQQPQKIETRITEVEDVDMTDASPIIKAMSPNLRNPMRKPSHAESTDPRRASATSSNGHKHQIASRPSIDTMSLKSPPDTPTWQNLPLPLDEIRKRKLSLGSPDESTAKVPRLNHVSPVESAHPSPTTNGTYDRLTSEPNPRSNQHKTSPRTIIRLGDRRNSDDGGKKEAVPPPRPQQQPTPANVRPPKKKKKDVDPFIKSKPRK